MAYALKGYSKFVENLMLGLIGNMADDSVLPMVAKFVLLKDTYPFDTAQGLHATYEDIKPYEITADEVLDPDEDYPEGGLDNDGSALIITAGGSVFRSSRVTTFDTHDPTLSDATIGAYGGALVIGADGADDDEIYCVAFSNFGALKASNSGTYKVVVNVAGWFTITVPA